MVMQDPGRVVCSCGIGYQVRFESTPYVNVFPCGCEWSMSGGIAAKGVPIYQSPAEGSVVLQLPGGTGECPCPVYFRQTVYCAAGRHWYVATSNRACACDCVECPCRVRERLFARLGTTKL